MAGKPQFVTLAPSVTPAKAGIQEIKALDSRIRGNDGMDTGVRRYDGPDRYDGLVGLVRGDADLALLLALNVWLDALALALRRAAAMIARGGQGK